MAGTTASVLPESDRAGPDESLQPATTNAHSAIPAAIFHTERLDTRQDLSLPGGQIAAR
ncbi:MAG TPA: hypothetical protein VHF06_04880 [Pseudonocardiaceae bacterium]|nr:hypothetical protein [Pseudonocardiaceae bacterium]